MKSGGGSTIIESWMIGGIFAPRVYPLRKYKNREEIGLTEQSGRTARILVVEDDSMLVRGMRDLLTWKGYAVKIAQTAAEAEACWKEWAADLYILDMQLPDGDGISLCRKLRRFSEAPVLFLTVCESEQYVVEALGSGGDDYVIKPFRTQELLARLEALLRRKQPAPAHAGVRVGEVTIDRERGVCRRGDRQLRLSRDEWKALWCLLDGAGKIVSREQLEKAIWKDGAGYVEENTLRVIISRLRRHLEDMGLAGAIETCRGQGYQWTLPVEVWHE